jgi:hypothetical protein
MPWLLYAHGKVPKYSMNGRLVDHRGAVDILEKRNITYPSWESNHLLPSLYLSHCTNYTIPVPCLLRANQLWVCFFTESVLSSMNISVALQPYMGLGLFYNSLPSFFLPNFFPPISNTRLSQFFIHNISSPSSSSSSS